MLGLTITSKAAPVQTVAVDNVGGQAGAAVAASAATTSASTSSKAAKSTAATGKKGKNVNRKRDGGLKWAARAMNDY